MPLSCPFVNVFNQDSLPTIAWHSHPNAEKNENPKRFSSFVNVANPGPNPPTAQHALDASRKSAAAQWPLCIRLDMGIAVLDNTFQPFIHPREDALNRTCGIHSLVV